MECLYYLGSGVSHERPSQTVEAIISVGREDGLVYTVRTCAYIPQKVGNGN